MNFTTVAAQMLILFAMMAFGYILYKLKYMPDNLCDGLSWLVIHVFNPFLIITSIQGKTLADSGSVFWQNLILVFAYYIGLFILGFVFVLLLKTDKSETPVYRLMTMLSNCGFMGIPVVSSLLGPGYVIYVAIYLLFYNIIIYTYGIYLLKKTSGTNTEKKSLSDTLKPLFFNPGIIACVIAMVLFFAGINLPKSVWDLCGYLSSPCVPLSMMLIGCSLASQHLVDLIKDVKMIVFTVLRCLALPIACAFLIRIIPFDRTILQIFIIMLAMPVGSMTVLVVSEYKGNTACASSGVALSTLLSILTIPIVAIFL